MDAVGADDRIRLDHLACVQRHARLAGVLGDRGALGAQPHGAGGQCGMQQIDEVGAVHVVHERAVAARRFLAERREVQEPAGRQVAVVVAFGHGGNGRQGRLQPQLAQHQRAVGGDLDARADLAQLGGALQHNRLDPVMAQGEGGGEATDAAANDHNSHANFSVSIN